jgi:VCBS repeat-containing protein
VLVSGPSHGTLTLNVNGSISYSPSANYDGSDSFTYRANDGLADSNAATVTLTITAVNDAPLATDDDYSTNEDTPLTVTAAGVLANDTDVDANPLTAVLVSGPSHGSLTLNADGSFNYIPSPNYSGLDSFAYRANDGSADSNAATVTLRITGTPIAIDDTYDVNQGATLSVPGAGVLANDSDPQSLPLAAVLLTGPAHGRLTFQANGTFNYVPDSGFRGIDVFSYQARNGAAASTPATVTIFVNPVVSLPRSGQSSSAIVRRTGNKLQVIDSSPNSSTRNPLLLDVGLASLHMLTIEGAKNQADTLVVDEATGGPFHLAQGIVFHGGAGSAGDQLVLVGTSGNDLFEQGPRQATVNGLNVQFTGLEYLAVRGADGDDRYVMSQDSVNTVIMDSRGTDWLDFSSSQAGVNLNLSLAAGQPQQLSNGNARTLALQGTIENVIGSAFADVIQGNAAANMIFGGTENDTLVGGAGNDLLCGQEGNDVLYGGSGNDVLDGGAGFDRLYGNQGRDILIGGLGNDALHGNGGDLLIGGRTIYDANPSALLAIMTQWSSSRTFAERKANLTNGFTISGLGTIRLHRGTTVLDDQASDALFADYSNDWLFSSPGDVFMKSAA